MALHIREFMVIGAIPGWLAGLIAPSVYNTLWWSAYALATSNQF